MQLIVPILLHLSNGSFLTVFSRAFVELCQRDFEAFDDFPGAKGGIGKIADFRGFRLRAGILLVIGR